MGNARQKDIANSARDWPGTIQGNSLVPGAVGGTELQTIKDSLENHQDKTNYRQRGSGHRRCHAWIRYNFLHENDYGNRSNPK